MIRYILIYSTSPIHSVQFYSIVSCFVVLCNLDGHCRTTAYTDFGWACSHHVAHNSTKLRRNTETPSAKHEKQNMPNTKQHRHNTNNKQKPPAHNCLLRPCHGTDGFGYVMGFWILCLRKFRKQHKTFCDLETPHSEVSFCCLLLHSRTVEFKGGGSVGSWQVSTWDTEKVHQWQLGAGSQAPEHSTYEQQYNYKQIYQYKHTIENMYVYCILQYGFKKIHISKETYK